MRKIIASIDIGTYRIKVIVAELIKNKIHILSCTDTVSKGLKKGLIVNPNEVILSIKEALKNVEDNLNIKITKYIATVPENNAEFMVSEATIKIQDPNYAIKGEDISEVLKESANKLINQNLELVNVIPSYFTLDNGETMSDPKKMISKSLKAKTVLSCSPKKNVYSVLSVLSKLNVDVIDITFGSISDYHNIKTENTEKNVGAVVNIGHSTTTVSIFNKGVLTNTEVIDIGGINIDKDIAYMYKINKKDANYLKENLALANKRLALASDTEEILNIDGEKIKINQYEISEIVQSRLDEMLNLIKKQINLLTKKQISYIIFTGGLTEIKDFELTLESVFGKNASICKIEELGARDNKYSRCLGMIKYFNNKLSLRGTSYSILNKEEEEELSTVNKRINVSNDSLIGKIFGYFFDN